MAKPLWEWKPRFAVVLVVRGLLIVTSHTNCDVTSCPVVMLRYANADGDEQRYLTSKTQVFLAFLQNCDRGRIEIDHLYGLHWSGWYSSGRATAGTTHAVPDCSNNHSSADRIVVNSYNHPLFCYMFTTCFISCKLFKFLYRIKDIAMYTFVFKSILKPLPRYYSGHMLRIVLTIPLILVVSSIHIFYILTQP